MAPGGLGIGKRATNSGPAMTASPTEPSSPDGSPKKHQPPGGSSLAAMEDAVVPPRRRSGKSFLGMARSSWLWQGMAGVRQKACINPCHLRM